jgi:hypothetical protein
VQALAEVQLVTRPSLRLGSDTAAAAAAAAAANVYIFCCSKRICLSTVHIALSKRVATLATLRTNSASCPAQRQHPTSPCQAPCPHLPITAQKGKHRCSRGRINFWMKRPCAAFERTPMTSALNLFACGRRHSPISTASARSALAPFHLKAKAKRRR